VLLVLTNIVLHLNKARSGKMEWTSEPSYLFELFFFCKKKYLLLGASSMLWVVDKSASQSVRDVHVQYVFHTNQIGSTINL